MNKSTDPTDSFFLRSTENITLKDIMLQGSTPMLQFLPDPTTRSREEQRQHLSQVIDEALAIVDDLDLDDFGILSHSQESTSCKQ